MIRKTLTTVVATFLVLAIISPAVAAPPQVWVDDDSQIGYRVTLWKNNDPAQKTIIEGTIDQIQSGIWVSPGVTLYASHWNNASLDSNPSLKEEYFAIMAIADAGSGVGVYEVEYPILKLNQLTEFPGQDRLLVPYGPGKAIVNPWSLNPVVQGGRPRQRSGIWYGIYGDSAQSMQMMMYDDGNPDTTQSRGMLLRVSDNNYLVKDFHVSKMGANDIFPQGSVYASVHHFPENAGQVGASFTGVNEPLYLTAVSCYEGGWEYAARERYRNWAIYQSWATGGRIMTRLGNGNLPAWFGNNVLWADISCSGGDPYYLGQQIKNAFPNIDIGVFVSQWQRWPFDVFNGHYFPPKNSSLFASLINMQGPATSQAAGIHLFPYINANLIDHDYGNPYAAGVSPLYTAIMNNLVANARIEGPAGNVPNPANIPSWDPYGNPMPGTSLSDNYFEPAECWNNHQQFYDAVMGQYSNTGLTEQFRNSLMAVRKKPWADSDVQNLVSLATSVNNTTGPGLYSPEFFGLRYHRDGIYNYLQGKWRTSPDQNGDYITPAEISDSSVKSRRKFDVLCRGTDAWRDFMFGLGDTLLKSTNQGGYGADGVYLDQLDGMRSCYVCFASDHSLNGQTHPKGFGNYMAAGSRTLASDLRTAHTDKVIFAEHLTEQTINVVHEHHMPFPQKATDVAVPLFATVYQGYTSMHEWYVSNDAVLSSSRSSYVDAVASGVHMGYKLGAIAPWDSYFDIGDSNAAHSLEYLRATASMLQQNLIELQTYGQRMSDPQFVGTTPTHSITRYGFYGDSASVTAPKVRGSCWRAYADWERLLLLSNSSSQPVTVTVKSSLFNNGEVLTDKALNTSGQPTNDTFTYSSSSGVTVTVPAYGWRALVR